MKVVMLGIRGEIPSAWRKGRAEAGRLLLGVKRVQVESVRIRVPLDLHELHGRAHPARFGFRNPDTLFSRRNRVMDMGFALRSWKRAWASIRAAAGVATLIP